MKWVLIIQSYFLLRVATAIFTQLVDEEKPSISIGSWKENDFQGEWHQNSSPPLGHSPFPNSIFVPASVRGLSLICNATYPIEFKFHRERWGGRSRLQFAIQTTRFSDGLDVQSFSSELSILGFDSSVSGNYTCQKVGFNGLGSSLHIFWEGNSPPFLTLARSYRKPAQIPFRQASRRFILPCTVAVPTVVPKLSKTVGDKEVELPKNRSVTFDPRVGFTLTDLKTPYGRYTCQVGDSEENEGDWDVIIFDVVDADDGLKPEFNDTIRHGAFYNLDSSSREITCCSASSKPPRLKLVECDHPTICALAKHTLHRMENSRKKNGSCASVSMRTLRAGIFRCVGDGIDVVREYFYPMPEQPAMPFRLGRRPRVRQSGNNASTNESSTIPPPPEPYFSWNEASEDKMMAVTKLTRPLYVGQQRRFYCRVSHFYYAQGIVWGLGYSNQSMEYVGGNEYNRRTTFGPGSLLRSRHFDIIYGRNIAYIDIEITPHLNHLACYAPIWNSTEWGRKPLELDVQVPEKPTLVGGPFMEVAWYLNETNKKLECVFDGVPNPTVVWKKGNQSTALHTRTVNGTSQMLFPQVGIDSQSEYQCIITNVAGNITRRFKVTVSHAASSAMSVALILTLVGFTAVTITLGLPCRYLKSQKSVISHLTNLAFKDVNSDGTGNASSSSNGTLSPDMTNSSSYTAGAKAPVHIDIGGAMLPPPSGSSSPTGSFPEKDISHENDHIGNVIISPQNQNGFSYKNYSSQDDVSPTSPGGGDPFDSFN